MQPEDAAAEDIAMEAEIEADELPLDEAATGGAPPVRTEINQFLYFYELC